MKQVEMLKWFKLPVDCNVVDTFDMSDAIAIDKYVALSSHHAEKVEVAINSYDQHIELIAKQAEQIKMLRDALLLSVPYLNFNSMEESKVEQALSATEQKL